jgi:hypothetical protein
MKLAKEILGKDTVRKNCLITEKKNGIEHMNRFYRICINKRMGSGGLKNRTFFETDVLLFSRYGAATKKVAVAPEN